MKKIERQGGPRRFHQASWDEPLIFELNNPGQIGIETPPPDGEMMKITGPARDLLPAAVRRQAPPALPRVGQARVLRHYLRLSQECLGAGLNVEIGQGTCTMKYNPPIDERIARREEVADLHPLQSEETVQGMLEILYRMQDILCEISGLDAVSLQPQSGSQALMVMASMIRKKQDADGHPEKDEMITTLFSHPSAAAAAIVKGFAIKTVRPRADGYPDFEHFKTLVGPRTAGLILANPEDTGLYNGKIRRFTDLIHQWGGLCAYDQANANGLFGVTRAREAGFDLCFFNLHKSFAAPHGCGGPGTGAVAAKRELAPFLPRPTVSFDGARYHLDAGDARSIGKARMFYGACQVAVKAYAWVMSLGAEGLREVAKVAALNNSYLYRRVLAIPGVGAPFDPDAQRVEQARYTLAQLCQETGVHSEEIGLRMADYGLHYWTSHHPFLVSEPMTLEPTESPSIEDLDEYADALAQVAREARLTPELVRQAPHNSAVHKNLEDAFDDPEQWAITYRAYKRKFAD